MNNELTELEEATVGVLLTAIKNLPAKIAGGVIAVSIFDRLPEDSTDLMYFHGPSGSIERMAEILTMAARNIGEDDLEAQAEEFLRQLGRG